MHLTFHIMFKHFFDLLKRKEYLHKKTMLTSTKTFFGHHGCAPCSRWDSKSEYYMQFFVYWKLHYFEAYLTKDIYTLFHYRLITLKLTSGSIFCFNSLLIFFHLCYIYVIPHNCLSWVWFRLWFLRFLLFLTFIFVVVP